MNESVESKAFVMPSKSSERTGQVPVNNAT